MHLHTARPIVNVLIVMALLFPVQPFRAAPAAAAGNDIAYHYDALGRLIAVVDPATDAARYSYDATGNLLSITRQSAAITTVMEFAPRSGVVGTSVTISGSGFSLTPSQNAVTFNGAAATVSSSTATQVVATVPAGATTGAIAVTAPGGSSTSTGSFTVLAVSGAPTISSLSATVADRGADVTVTGTNFDPTAASNVVALNGSRTSISTASGTSLTMKVPSVGTSGKVVVATAGGQATSAADLFVPPAPYVATDVLATGRVAYGGNVVLSLSTPNKIGLAVFDGTVGQRVSLNVTSTVSYTRLTLYKPDGGTFQPTWGFGGAGLWVEPFTLPMSGTYTMLVDPDGTYTGNVTINVYNVPPDVTGTISIGGPPVNVTITTPGQDASLTFSGTAGQRMSFLISSSTVTYTYVRVAKPDGTNLINNTGFGSSIYFDTMTLPATGTYTIYLGPYGSYTGSMTLTLYDVPADTTDTISIGGATVVVTTTVPGQNGSLTFSGTANQKISLVASSVTYYNSYVSVIKPDGTNLINPTSVGTGGRFFGPGSHTLPTTGTYTIFVNPDHTYTGSMTLTLYDANDVTGTIAIGGPPVNVTITAPGQIANLTFSGTAAQQVSLNVTAITSSWTWFSIKNPDGTNLLAPVSVNSPTSWVRTLVQTGTHTVVVDPDWSNTGSVTMTLTQVGGMDLPLLAGDWGLGAGEWEEFLAPDRSGSDWELDGWSQAPTSPNFGGGVSVASLAPLPLGEGEGEGDSRSRGRASLPRAADVRQPERAAVTFRAAALQTPATTQVPPPVGPVPTAAPPAIPVAPLPTAFTILQVPPPAQPQPPVGPVPTASTPLAPLGPLPTALAQQAPLSPLPTAIAPQPPVGPVPTALAPSPQSPAPSPQSPAGPPGPPAEPTRPPIPFDPPSFYRGGLEDWEPAEPARRGDWRSHRPDSPWEYVPALEAEPGATALAGRVLLMNGEPLSQVTLKLAGITTRTDETGRFLLTGLPSAMPVAQYVLLIDGRTASGPGQGRAYGIFEVAVEIAAGKTTVLPYTIWMPRTDTAHGVHIPSPTTSEVVVRTPHIPGLELHIPAGTTITDIDGQPVNEVSITAIPVDRPPFPLPGNVPIPVYFTIQPGGAQAGPSGVYLVYPNYSGATAGERIDFWHYDPVASGWHIYGKGTVSPDGAQIVPDAGVRFHELTGAMIGAPSLAPSEGPAPGNGGGSAWIIPEDMPLALSPGSKPGRDGDPLDLGTGLFVMEHTDLALPDSIHPVSLTRTYRQKDTASRAFGIGASHPYDIFLVGDTSTYSYVDLVLADGGKVHFVRTSAGTGYQGSVFEHTATPTRFYKSTIKWVGTTSGYWELTLLDGTVLTFPEAFGVTRSAQAAVNAIRDRYGNTLGLGRDANRNLTTIRSSGGRWIELTYDGNNRITQAKDVLARTVSYTYDGSGRLSTVTDAAGGVTTYTYDASHRMLTIKDPKNITYLTNTYDANGRVTVQTQADGTSYQFAYTVDANGKVTRTDVTDPRGSVRRVTFSNTGYTLADTEAHGTGLAQTVTYERPPGPAWSADTGFSGGSTFSTTAAINGTTDDALYQDQRYGNFSYSLAVGNGTYTVTLKFAELYFNNVGQRKFHVSIEGQTVLSSFDILSEAAKYTALDKSFNVTVSDGTLNIVFTPVTDNPVVNAIEVSSSPATRINAGGGAYQSGNSFVAAAIDPLGRRTEYVYDAKGNVTSVTALAGTGDAVTSSFTYGGTYNQLLTATDPLGHTTTMAYDSKGSLTSVTDALGHTTTVAYNTAGQPTSVTDALNNTTTLAYALGDLTSVTDPLGRVATQFQDNGGRVLSAADPLGNKAQYQYSALNQVTQAIDALGGVTAMAYDANGNLLSLTDARNGATTYTYNSMDRVTSRTDPLLRAESYVYDAGGLLTQATDRNSQVTSFTYDALGRMTQASFAGGSTITYTYDGGNRLTQAVDSVGGTITSAYDTRNRLTSETTAQGSISYTYDAVSRRTGSTVTGQPQVTYAYDNGDRLTGITQSGSTVSYTYDNADRVTSITLPDGIKQSYSYDAASQLTGITYTLGANTLGALTHEYDKAGRRTSVGGSFARTGLPSALSSATYNAANQLTNWAGTALTYDNNGNMTSDGTNTYTWNSRNQLTGISGGVTASFSYDAFGRRTGKTLGGATTNFAYDGANPVQELSGGTPTSNLMTGLGVDQRYSRTESGATSSLLTDALGSTIALADSAGTIQTSYTYEPFGKTSVSGAASTNPYRFTGREDDGTGLFFYRARYYHPTFQRFISEDPIGFAGGQANLYAYVGNSPTNMTDRSGRGGSPGRKGAVSLIASASSARQTPDDEPDNTIGPRLPIRVPPARALQEQLMNRENVSLQYGSALGRPVSHHLIPAQFKLEMWMRFRISVNDYIVKIPERVHQAIHCCPPGAGRWNREWDDFLNRMDIGEDDVFHFMNEMVRRYGIDLLWP